MHCGSERGRFTMTPFELLIGGKDRALERDQRGSDAPKGNLNWY